MLGGSEDNWICKSGQWVKHGNPSNPKPTTICGKKIPLPKTKDECLKIGGVWKKMGPDPFETCNKKTIDVGRECDDASQCEGTCLAKLTKEELRSGMKGKIFIKKKGGCSPWVVTLGCQGIVKNGITSILCID